MKTTKQGVHARLLRAVNWLMLGLAVSVPASAGNTDLATAPLITSSASSVYPNIFVMMDDSGSMDWDFLPDNQDLANFPIGTYGYASAQCNGVFYDPAVTYSAPYKYDGTQYPNSSFTNAPNDGYGVLSNQYTNLATSFTLGQYQDDGSSNYYSGANQPAGTAAYYYLYKGTQTSAYAKNFNNTSSRFFTECDTTVSSVTSTFRISTRSGGSGAVGVSSISVSGSNITTVSMAASKYPQVLGAEIVAAINSGGVAGYSATCSVSGVTCSLGSTSSSSATIIIVGPSSVAGGTISPVLSTNGGNVLSITSPSAFGGSSVFNTVTVSSTSGPGNTDERTNFANWWSYYRTRINMMKSSLGTAFQALGSTYQVGFATMNNNGGSDMVNIAPFTSTQKNAWYNKIYHTSPSGGTGLITALANVGKLYAHKLSGNKLNGVSVTDPVGYSCQQNFTILSTDGYWNVSNTSASLTGTAVGNQDGGDATIVYGPAAGQTIAANQPYCDGNTTCSGSSNSGSGSSNTLADVAMYYYMNDIRVSALGNCTSGSTGNNVCTDNVPTSTNDPASWHHMTLFTIGLGAPGYMVFDPNYANETATSTIHDYFDILNGTPSNASCTGAACPCPWNTNGSSNGYYSQTNYTAGQACEWPLPNVSGIGSNIDDLWHAAVNGHGSYYSATNASSLAAGLNNALAAVKQALSNSAAASTSNPNITSSSNFVFTSDYNSVIWDGELSEYTIDVTTGLLSTNPVWTAATQLDAITYTSRNIYFNKGGTLTPFTWANLSTTQQSYFQTPYISTLSQYCVIGTSCLSAAQQLAGSGQPMFNFVLGDRTNESSDNSAYFRARTHVLGDIVDSQAAYVGASLFQYSDTGYSAFATANATRAGVVYVGANDGMLHAFNAGNSATNPGTGAELWAFVPTSVIKNMYILGDKNYANLHQYFVDGSPTVGDVYFGGAWHTILVGGLNDGGMSYYALDVTNPTSPSLLWEFTDTNLGYSYSTPLITKLQNGTWVVMFASGYNNNSGGGDGKGHLYVLNAQTGAIMTGNTTVTTAGSTSSPSGLTKISGYATAPTTDNTTLRVYGGDLLGNLWRFDPNGGTAPQLLVTLKDTSNNVQPITSTPELGLINNIPMVYIGTGEYLGVSDLSNSNQQTFYGIKDPLTTVSGAIYTTSPQASGSNFVAQTFTSGTCPAGESASVCSTGQSVVTESNNSVDLTAKNGWYVNFPTGGERANTDATLVLGELLFATNTPSSSACVTGGSSIFYSLDASTGGPVSSTYVTSGGVTIGVAGISLGNFTTSGVTAYQLPASGGNSLGTIICKSNGSCAQQNPPQNPTKPSPQRVGWHEVD